MEKYNNKFDFYRPNEEPEEKPLNFDSAEKIVSDLLQAEKDVAKETLYLLKNKYEKERQNWEKILAQKEQERLSLKSQIGEAHERVKQLQAQFDGDKQEQVRNMQERIKEIQEQELSDKKKWEHVTDEVRKFKEEANIAQKKYLMEQNRAGEIKKEFYDLRQKLSSGLEAKEEELNELKESFLKKEEAWIREKSHYEEELNVLKDQAASLQQIINDDRQSNDKESERKDLKIKSIEETCQNAVSQLSIKVEREKDVEREILGYKENISRLKDEKEKILQVADSELSIWKKGLQDEQEKSEKQRKEAVDKEETIKKDIENQKESMLRSIKILEQHLAEEHKLKIDTEVLLAQKEQEITRLMSQRDELVSEWKRVVSDEQNNFKKRQAELSAEFNRISQLKDDEINRLQRNTNELSAALSEEKRLLQVEKEKSHQTELKMQYQEEDKKRISDQTLLKEKDWQIVLTNEQEFLKKQIEEIKLKSDGQVQSRESEIMRLNKELDMMNKQLSELRDKYFIQKNENNENLEKIQEMGIHVKMLNEKHEKAKAELQKKYQSLQLEKEKSNDMAYKEINLRQNIENKNRELIEDNQKLKVKLDKLKIK